MTGPVKRWSSFATLLLAMAGQARAQGPGTAEPLGMVSGSPAGARVDWSQGRWTRGWAHRQLIAALDDARRQLAAPTVAASAREVAPRLADVLVVVRRLDSTQVNVTADGDGLLISAYADEPDRPARFEELRLRYRNPALGDAPITLAVSAQACDLHCEREREDVLLWTRVADAPWALSAMVSANGPDLQLTSFGERSDAAPAEVRSTLTGTVRDERGRPLAGVEVFAAGAVQSVRTDSTGHYRLTLSPRRGEIVGMRKLGVLPTYRVLAAQDTGTVSWSPRLKSAQVLATRLIRASRAPRELQARRYQDFLARQERGTGQFLTAEEIGRHISLGDALNTLRGINVSMVSGYYIQRVRVPRCAGADSTIGVFVDGVDLTWGTRSRLGSRPPQGFRAEDVLMEFHPSGIVALEFFRRTEMPPEYAGLGYCAVVGLWSR